ncbi:MAG: DNA repair protein RadC [Alphaproteobacteria bacterium]|jgi:DNA repair protein RadC|nr:DNA repair protein RadC [Alphaproteobacteria bacterium]MBU1525912.1 DNA repair protein RadC [Alphaproteobacteria bacterium]MBU2116575.1 DNA repair protein RadC [Alphaproteobacteria bacterium]MBU2352043.1 DNA repair protein RadC [Alphaproteobacteria bacterium]MBU2381111.1 DNA repair protein RadC [Alphaproteobacteria bacterium]
MRPIAARSVPIDLDSRTPPAVAQTSTSTSTLDEVEDRDLLCLLLARSLPGHAPEQAATDLMNRFGNLGDIAAAEVSELGRITGLGPAGILDLKLLRQLSIRLARHTASARPVLSSWAAVVDYARLALAHLPREQFRVLYLDRRNILLRDEWVADGSIDHAPVYPREVIRRALELSASALILVHNHPSGDPTPSQADIKITRQIVDGAKLFGLQVHDHLIVGREGTASFRTLGLL